MLAVNFIQCGALGVISETVIVGRIIFSLRADSIGFPAGLALQEIQTLGPPGRYCGVPNKRSVNAKALTRPLNEKPGVENFP